MNTFCYEDPVSGTGPVRIVAVGAVPLTVSFRETFRFGTMDRRRPKGVVVVRSDDGHVGYGEARSRSRNSSSGSAVRWQLYRDRAAHARRRRQEGQQHGDYDDQYGHQ